MKRKILFYLILISSVVKAEWQTIDSTRLQNIESDVHAINTVATESGQELTDIKNNVYQIKQYWKPVLDNIEQHSSGIKGHTTYIYNVLQSLAAASPTIAQTSWFGQLLQNTKDLKTKLDLMSTDLSDIKYRVENLDTNVSIIQGNVSSIDNNLYTIKDNTNLMKDDVSSIYRNVYENKQITTEIKDDVSTISDYQSQILKAIQIGDTNLYNSFFNPASAQSSFYSVNNRVIDDYEIGLDSKITDPIYSGQIPSTPGRTQSFSESLFLYLNRILAGSSFNTKLLSTGLLNIQDIRNVGLNTITNQLAEIISKTNTVAKIEVDKINLDYTPIRQYGANVDIHNAFTTENLNTTGDFYQDVIKFSKAQVELQSGNNLGLLSIVTNLQIIVAELTKPSETNDLENSAQETEQEITKDLEDNQDNDGKKYIGFKNEYQNIQNSLSFGSLGDDVKSYSNTLQIMDRHYFEMGSLSIEIPSIEVSLDMLDKITTFVRFVMTICWVGILLSLIFMFYRFFVFFSSKFIEFTSKMTGQ